MAKTKAEIIGLDTVTKNLKTFIKNVVKEKDILNELGDTASKQISLQTKSKQKDYRQPDLKKSSIKRRESLIKQGNGSEFAKPKQSNLTLSGQLLNALTYKINQSTGFITLFFKEGRRPYKGKSGQSLEQKTNREIVQDLDARGFKFFFISDRLKAQLESKLKAYIRRKLSNYKKLKRSLK